MISRRNFLKAVVAGMTVYPFKKVLASTNNERALRMYNIHTGESLDIKYYDSGIYDLKALKEINHLLRCHYTNEVKDIDPRVIDLLQSIREITGKNKRIEIISGYRSPLYNKYLIEKGRHVVRNSLHQQGLAIDFTIPGVGNERLSSIARSFAAGGVGKYPEFVHIDTGRVRNW